MPKIKITEKDQTGRVQQGVISNVVYLPIRFNGTTLDDGSFAQIGSDLVKVDSKGDFSGLRLFKSADSFKNAAKVTPEITLLDPETQTTKQTVTDTPFISEKSMGYKLCVHLLNCGFEVLVEALDDKSAPSWEALKDKSLYDVRFLTLGSFVEGRDKSTNISGFDLTGEVQNMISTAAYRGDCIALVNADESADNFDYKATSVRTQFDSTDGEYAAAFTPWFKTTNSDFQNEGESKVVYTIPAAFGYLFAYANATKNNPEWYAIAGFDRGVIPELSDVCHEYSTADVEVLQGRSVKEDVKLDDDADNIGFAINPICYVRPAGHIIYGNRTLRENTAAKKLIASSFLNIRNGVSAIKKLMYEASRKYTFEQNNETLWINFQAYITPLLDKMQSGNGILGYTFIKQKTDAKARLKATLNIIPVEAVEDFELEVVLTDDLNVNE